MSACAPGRVMDGPAGWAQEGIITGLPFEATVVACWLMNLPGQAPAKRQDGRDAWEHYLLQTVSLSPVDGVPAAVLSYPRAEYEIVMQALDEDQRPILGDVNTWLAMDPPNYARQFHGISREQAALVSSVLVSECVSARLAGETQTCVTRFDGTVQMMYLHPLVLAWDVMLRMLVENFGGGVDPRCLTAEG